jgi:CubicO group peptidase (beta-lactamase class C family)
MRGSSSPLLSLGPSCYTRGVSCIQLRNAIRMRTSGSTPDLDALLDAYAAAEVPGTSLVAVRDSKVVYTQARGLAHLEQNVPCAINTMFRLASISKSFTAAAVLILIDRGMLAYESTIAQIFPEFPAYGHAITIEHLLTHTSGVIDYEENAVASQPPQLNDHDVLTFLEHQKRTYFPPGTQYRYSNAGYVLLALIVEVVSKRAFGTFLTEEIFSPLQMTSTVAGVPQGRLAAQRAFGYTLQAGRYVRTDQNSTSATLGDGGIYSSVEDLCHWDAALRTGMVLRPVTLHRAFSPHAQLEDGSAAYGYGWYLSSYRNVPVMWHDGTTVGFRNMILRFPEQQGCVVVLTNRAGNLPKELAYKLADTYVL